MGIQKFIRGILMYRKSARKQMVEQFERIRDNPKPKAVLFTCMDSRVLPTRFTQSDVGDMFVVRNAGNLVPHAKLFGTELVITTEPAALELACVVNKIRDVIVCGHSDCKAMNLLHAVRTPEEMMKTPSSPLRQWVSRHGATSLTHWEKFEASGFKAPLTFDLGSKTVLTHIDPDNKFEATDKLSQINALTQLQNVASYPFMQPLIKTGEMRLHALWFDIYTGEIYYFSQKKGAFAIVNEETSTDIMDEISAMYIHSEKAVAA
ncbi:beta carbonic anhydrase 1-like [Artemia franciscana]|uniref:beta carbonic anhydrase 1-like n=1 Tax=Artemia franciscana TaxID=6661 RepID=UPI0032D9DC18